MAPRARHRGTTDGPCPQDVPSSVSLGGRGTHCRVQGRLGLLVARPAKGEATTGPALRPAPLATPHTAQQHHHRADRAPAHGQAGFKATASGGCLHNIRELENGARLEDSRGGRGKEPGSRDSGVRTQSCLKTVCPWTPHYPCQEIPRLFLKPVPGIRSPQGSQEEHGLRGAVPGPPSQSPSTPGH